MNDGILATITTGDDRSAIEKSSDPNLTLLLWLWGPRDPWSNPFRRGPWVVHCAQPFKGTLVRVNSSFQIYKT